MMFECYKIRNIVNRKCYIGITGQGIKVRFRKHLKLAEENKGFAIHNAINKYGVENFTCEVIAKSESRELIERHEKDMVEFLGTYIGNNGYNMTHGGEGIQNSVGYKRNPFSDEHKLKLSESHKGHVGEKNGFYGKHHTEAFKKAKSEVYTGIKHSEERKEKARIGRKNSKAVELKYENSKKAVIQYNKEGKFIAEYNGVVEAQKLTNCHQISAVCKGSRKTSGGYIWRYKNNNN